MNAHVPSTTWETPHRYAMRVYYEDTDAGGIVYYANYLRFIERARTEALRDLGIPHADLVAQFGVMFVVRRVEMDYLLPARLDDLLSVTTAAEDIGGASLLLRQDVFAADATMLATARVRLACVGTTENRPKRMPPAWRAKLHSLRPATGAAAPRNEYAATQQNMNIRSGL